MKIKQTKKIVPSGSHQEIKERENPGYTKCDVLRTYRKKNLRKDGESLQLEAGGLYAKLNKGEMPCPA